MTRVILLAALALSANAVVLRSGENVLRGEKKNFPWQKSEGNTPREDFVVKLRNQYLDTVKMGLLGGLNHGAFTDITRGGATAVFNDGNDRNECLTRDFDRKGIVDICIIKWDANERLSRVEQLYNLIREQNIPGDLMECGVWRGGMTLWMKALLKAHNDEGRKVIVSDSFNGVPNAMRQKAETKMFETVPDFERQADLDQWGGSVEETDLNGNYVQKNMLTVEQELVTDNFKRFNLLDDGVKFITGYFNDTLPNAEAYGVNQLALLRVDGDLYSSTMDVLDNLYDKVSPGGFVIFDDWPLPQSKMAIHDFFVKKGLDEKLLITGPRLTVEHRKDKNDQDPINEQAYFQKPKW